MAVGLNSLILAVCAVGLGKRSLSVNISDLGNASACTVLLNPTDSILLWAASA